MSNLDTETRRLLTEAQEGIEIAGRPFRSLAERAGIEESEAIDILNDLKGDIIRRFGGVFRSGQLGFKSTLLAASVAEARIRAVAREINKLPGVTHNYRRSHDYNLWFTLTVGPEDSLDQKISKLEEDLDIEILQLPAIKRYKLGVKLDLQDKGKMETKARDAGDKGSGQADEVREARQDIYRPDQLDRNIIALLQEDIELVARPFKVIADSCGCGEDEVLARLKQMKEAGALKRIAPLLYHRRSGYQANGMVVWKMAGSEIDEAGYQLAAFDQVSHCYHRPAYPPDWPFNLYAMTHAKTQAGLEATAEEMAEEIGNKNYQIIYSLEEFKKSSMKYYSFNGRG
ncbi:AsnC family transcriptional regulator [Halanaerobiaceae bacterium Z-7014]|uniref:siroheme decarboxylase n=1 Tax=Halonatronomonas betaini TaxID=2778430 RepID=A0A931AXD4_9FIRM|nr:AsnC family transcriptional regulator [Halonatronomonas betaini]MBF8437791.1 AsnC family transcriptional regulator [Halonatronomonas betaini]